MTSDMSEQVGKYTCSSLATAKNKEILRNIALAAWIIGMAPTMMAVVILNGTQIVFSSLVFINAVFLILNCGFCCVNLDTLRKKRAFFSVCLIFMIANVAVLFGTLIQASHGIYQIIGFAGFALISIACLALVILNILWNIHGPQDPLAINRAYEPESLEDLSADSSDEGYVNVRYVSIRRGRLRDGANFQVEAGQILSLAQPNDVTNNGGQSTAQQSTPNNISRLCFLFGERTQRHRGADTERHVPIRVISDGMFDSYRRDSSTSLLRRTSMESVEYDTSSVRCTCFYSSNETADADEVPPYSEAPTGNTSRCPIHGLNSISPPPYDEDISAYNVLCSVIGLPKYDDVVIAKPSILSYNSNLEAANPTCHTNSPANTSATTRRTSTIAPALFDTIIEDGSETDDEVLSEDVSREYNPAGTSSSTLSSLAGTTIVTSVVETDQTTETVTTLEEITHL